MNRLKEFVVVFAIGAMSLVASSNLYAAEVHVGLSARECYVGVPVTLQVHVNNAADVKPPEVPSVDGLQIQAVGTPARSTQITTINGRTTTNTSLTYNFEVTPQRAGSFRIPPIAVHVDGADQRTPSIELVATKSETGDVLFVEVAGKQREIYVGQPLELTLKIWLRPYRDRERGITLSEGDMWRMISDRSNWGPFAERMQQLSEKDQRPAGKEVLRKDANGESHSYYLYEVDATIYPKRPGEINANDVKVSVQYPTAIGKSRDPFAGIFDNLRGGRPSAFGEEDPFDNPFGSRLEVKRVRPIVGETHVDPIQVLPIPTIGRPADYRGAVGKYVVAVEATPTTLKAGDPIELLIGISGTGPMDLVQAPPLADLPELTKDFKVPSEPLAGFVKDSRKVFSTSIRPRKAGVDRIPSIPFSYFDPEAKKFVTVRSEPVAIHVDPADTLSLDAIAKLDGKTPGAAADKPSAEVAASGDSFANYSGPEILEPETPFLWNTTANRLLIAAPPLLVLALAAFRFRYLLGLTTSIWRSPLQRCKQQIDGAESAKNVAAAVQGFVAKKMRMRQLGSETEVLGSLRSHGYRNLAIRCERLFDDCEADAVLGGVMASRELDQLKRDALQIVDDLQLETRTDGVRPIRRTRGKKTASRGQAAALLPLVFLATSVLIASQAGNGLADEQSSPHSAMLSPDQQRALLSEANELYGKALKAEPNDAATAKQDFEAAAEKYQLLVTNGIQNSRLFANLGNAYFKADQLGRAVANYHHSLRLDPTNRIARDNLRRSEEILRSRGSSSSSETSEAASSKMPAPVLFWIKTHVGRRSLFAIWLTAWTILWAAIAARLVRFRIPWKSIAVVTGAITIAAVGFFVFNSRSDQKHLVVIVTHETKAHEADGATFPIADVPLREGQIVQQLKSRGDWLEIRSDTGQTGWVPQRDVESI
jgi:tetratricopeptide (TPR) repeat protein